MGNGAPGPLTRLGGAKFVVTMTGMALGAAIALAGRMDPYVASVLATGIGAFSWANARITQAALRKENHVSE